MECAFGCNQTVGDVKRQWLRPQRAGGFGAGAVIVPEMTKGGPPGPALLSLG
jgi:hypothetical protein